MHWDTPVRKNILFLNNFWVFDLCKMNGEAPTITVVMVDCSTKGHLFSGIIFMNTFNCCLICWAHLGEAWLCDGAFYGRWNGRSLRSELFILIPWPFINKLSFKTKLLSYLISLPYFFSTSFSSLGNTQSLKLQCEFLRRLFFF